MSDPFAVPLPRDIYDCKEFTSLFQPRIHRQTSIADHASVQCQIELYGEEGVGSKFGNMNTHAGNFVSLCAPNCRPERLALAAYTIENGFLHDDDLDSGTDEQVLQENEMLRQFLRQSGATSITSKLTEAKQRKSEVQAKIVAEFMRQDPVFGNYLLLCWEAFLKTTEDGRNLDFGTLDNYLAFRLDDVGAVWTLAILRWGTGIKLTAEEEHIADPIAYVAYAALALTNDLLSWNKEYKAYIENQQSAPWPNAVNLVMAWHGLEQDAAKVMIRDEIRAHEKRFCQLRDEYMSSLTPSSSIANWLRLLEDSMAGNFIWSIRCPRYYQMDRNPYRDHLEAFGKDKIKIITASVEVPGPVSHTSISELSKREYLKNNRLKGASLTGSLSINKLKLETVLNPYTYIASLPSKNVRQTIIMALNLWYKVPEKSLLIVEGVVNFLHNSSLLLDDIQDGSSLRRGKPAAHCIFGIGQTINTATYLMNEALCLVQMLSQSAQTAYSEEMRNLHIGQGHDLHWTYHTHVPSQEEYISMVDGKTGGLFRLICWLMKSEASINRDLDLTQFATLLGRYFQIRDDYQNLVSTDYKQNKGFCDDLDEGKLSFPVILAMNSPEFPKAVMLSIFQSQHERRGQSPELKQYILDQISSRGVFSHTRNVLKDLHSDLLRCLSEVENRAGGIENWTLRLLFTKLDIANEVKIEPGKQESAWEINQQKVWKGHQSKRPSENAATGPSKKRKRG